MTRRSRLIAAGLVVATALGLWSAADLFLPGDEDVRRQVVAEVERRFGVKVAVAAVHWQVLPVPMVTLRGAKTHQKQPIEIRQLSIYPNLRRALLHRRFSVERLELDGAIIPTASLAAFRGKQESAVANPYVALVEHVRFRSVTWISRIGIPVPIEGEIDFDPLWRPHHAQVRRTDFKPVASITLERQGDADRWTARVALGTGSADGRLALRPGRNGTLLLGGTLEPRGIEVASAAESLNRRSPIGGKANGRTVVSAHGKTAGDLGQSLRLLTEFTIAPATVLHFDLDKAIRTAGKEHDGQTMLESLTGVLDMQNTAEGTVLRYTELEAHSGSFTVQGEATLFNRKVEAQGTLHLIQGVVGIPFTISGSTQEPKVTWLGQWLGAKPEPPGTPETEPTPPMKP